ncbi:uncharacterized protein LOC129539514 [Moschus berezovskii]|uniref:uncharacterized protein LOC129539514 n=1 Tax=Moschus berezovskii TaxID=68408 RepID=UPI002444B859|nr:uncharacterized protein LOC129539514 [Moschus berezovskii]
MQAWPPCSCQGPRPAWGEPMGGSGGMEQLQRDGSGSEFSPTGAGRDHLLAQRLLSTTTGLWKAGWRQATGRPWQGPTVREVTPASSGNLGGGGAPDVLHVLGSGSRLRNVAAERCQERPWGRARNPPTSKNPDLPGRGSWRSRPPLPLPPSPRGKSLHPVAGTPHHSLCSRSHSADICWDPSEDQAQQAVRRASSTATGFLRSIMLTCEALPSGASITNLTFHSECVCGPGVRLFSLRLLLHTLVHEPFPGEELRGWGPEHTCVQRHPPIGPFTAWQRHLVTLRVRATVLVGILQTLGFFLIKPLCIYLFGCVRSQLRHVGPSLSRGVFRCGSWTG